MRRRRTALYAMGGGPLSCGIPIALLPEEGEGGGGTGSGGTGGEPKHKEDPPKPDVVSMSQEKLSKLLAQEKDQGQRGALKQAAEAAGYKDFDAILEIANKQKQAELAQMDEAQRKLAEANDVLAAAKLAEARAKTAAFEALAHKHLSKAEVTDAEIGAAALLGGQFGLTAESEEAAIEEAVKKLKERTPGLFGPKTSGGKTGDPGKPAPGAKGGAGDQKSPADAEARVTRQLERVARRRPGSLPEGVTTFGSGGS